MNPSSFPDLNAFPEIESEPNQHPDLQSHDEPLSQPNQQPDLQSESNPVDPFQTQVPTTHSRTKYPSMEHHPRSSKLVRVAPINPSERRHIQEVVRKIRLIYDSLFVHLTFKHEKAKTSANQTKLHAYSEAATLMRQNGLWLNTDMRVVGDLPGISIGDVFVYRMEMCVLGLHRQPQAGIDYLSASHCSIGEPIATSIIISGGYEDDKDEGDEIVYTGQGGQDGKHQQVKDQKLDRGNLALENSMNYGVAVRVIRKIEYDGTRTGNVYVYDGLYKIDEAWTVAGNSGFLVFKFKLVRIENQEEMGSAIMKRAAMLKGKPLEVRQGYVSLDISRGTEKFGVYFFNDIDNRHDPIHFNYILTSVFPQFVYNAVGSSGCGCEGGCVEGCICFMKNGNEFPYDQNGILVKGKPLVFECGPHCHCPPSCQNRVSQKGIKNRFEVFRSKETSWGVRSLDLIQAGSFLREYAGVVLTPEMAPTNTDNLIFPCHFTERWREWGDLSKVNPNYVCPSYPAIPPLNFAMEMSKNKNLACYIRHSTIPNVFVQLVLHDHNNLSFPRLMLFAMENIPPMKELSLDYGVTGKPAFSC